MTPFVTEVLKSISDNPAIFTQRYKDNYAIRTILEYAFDKTKKFILPEGEPPYKKDNAPLGLSQANFYQQVKKFYVFLRTDISNVRREILFIQLLESLHPTEAEVVIAIKDQNLTSLYPGITTDFVVKEGVVKEENVFRLQPTEAAINLSDVTERVEKKRGRKSKQVDNSLGEITHE